MDEDELICVGGTGDCTRPAQCDMPADPWDEDEGFLCSHHYKYR
jgi:hypothetical protein